MSTNEEIQRASWRSAHMTPLWESPTAHKRDAGPEKPTLWPWRTIQPLAIGATTVKSPAAIERRVLSLVNPTPRWPDDEATLRNLSAAIQTLLPGETARPHRHSMNALRFVLQGEGGVTFVNGKPCAMSERDMILTPAWTWHEHVHRGTGPLIWLDVLDVPLHNFLGTASFQPGPVPDIPPQVEDAVFHYPWASVEAALQAAPPSRDGSRQVRYVNPLTGGPAMALLDAWVMEIDGGTPTVPFRASSNAVVSVVEGQGTSLVGDETVAWEPRDLFTLPAGNQVTHRSRSARSRLLVVSDREIFRRLDLLTEEWA